MYITNQMTRHDRTYNETGADFLREINRLPQDVDEIVNRLAKLYGKSISREELRADFIEFIEGLDKHLFLVQGETIEELNAKDIDFSYSLENPKTLIMAPFVPRNRALSWRKVWKRRFWKREDDRAFT